MSTHEEMPYTAPYPCKKGTVGWTILSPDNAYSTYEETDRVINCDVCKLVWEFANGRRRELHFRADLEVSRAAWKKMTDLRATEATASERSAADAAWRAASKAVRKRSYDDY